MGANNGVTTVLLTAETGRGHAVYGLDKAWVTASCPHCGGVQALRVALAPDTEWYRCATCLGAFVRNHEVTSPARLPLRKPDKLPAEDEAVWEEARICLGSGAYMAAVMLCRKLLLHIAVDNGLPEKNDKGRGPGFAECVEHLADTGVITHRMLEWVEPIKDIGNEATHKIVTVTQEQAEQVATFTLQLLVLAYELRMTASSIDTTSPNPTGASADDHAGVSGETSMRL